MTPLVEPQQEFCFYGCGQPGNFKLKNGKPCCSPRHVSCPVIRGRNTATQQGHAPETNWKEVVTLLCVCGASFERTRLSIERSRTRQIAVMCRACAQKQAIKNRWAKLSPAERKAASAKGIVGFLRRNARMSHEDWVAQGQHSAASRDKEELRRSCRNGRAVLTRKLAEDPEFAAFFSARQSQGGRRAWAALTPEQRQARIEKLLKMTGRSNSGDAFIQALRTSGLTIDSEQGVGGYLVDGLHLATKTIIEFYGDFWHCNPARYQDPDQYCGWLNRTVAQQWARDRRRLGVFYSLGFQVIIVWESEWKCNRESVLARICKKVGAS